MSALNLTKTGKKASFTLASAVASPSNQRSIDIMMQQEKMNTFQKEVQAMFQSIQETIAAQKEEIRVNHSEVKGDLREMKEQIQNMDGRLENFQQIITKTEQRIQKIKDKSEETEKRMEELTQANKNLETVIILGMEKAAHFLRFQNIEKDKEDLPKVMTELLENALRIDKKVGGRNC